MRTLLLCLLCLLSFVSGETRLVLSWLYTNQVRYAVGVSTPSPVNVDLYYEFGSDTPFLSTLALVGRDHSYE
jgi:hypothetical protein